MEHVKVLEPRPHHVQQEVCTSRPKYRQGRKLTAVKAFTVNQESQYLLIHGVPSIGLQAELGNLCSKFGKVAHLKLQEDYPAERFTQVWLIKYQRIISARFAKKHLDERTFFGGSLHVCYAPECETVNETRLKLHDRMKNVAARIRTMESLDSRTRHGAQMKHLPITEDSQMPNLNIVCETLDSKPQPKNLSRENSRGSMLQSVQTKQMPSSSCTNEPWRNFQPPKYVDRYKTNGGLAIKTVEKSEALRQIHFTPRPVQRSLLKIRDSKLPADAEAEGTNSKQKRKPAQQAEQLEATNKKRLKT